MVITGMGCISAAWRNVEEHYYAIEQWVRSCQQVQAYPVYSASQDALTETGNKLLAAVRPGKIALAIVKG